MNALQFIALNFGILAILLLLNLSILCLIAWQIAKLSEKFKRGRRTDPTVKRRWNDPR